MVSAVRRLVGLVGLVALVATLLTGCSGGSYELTATFDDVGDLVTDHSVQMADVRVGRVTGIELTDDFRAKVTMRVDDSVKVPRESVAVVSKTSLLGEKFIELRPTGEPDQGPFLDDGDDLGLGVEAPELEFVAEQAISLLGSVVATDVATLVETGAAGFGGRRSELTNLITNLATISDTLADHSGDIATIIDGLDRATTSLAGGRGDISALLTNLADTTRVLAEDRDRAVTALRELSRLAGVQNDLLDRYRADVDRQIGEAEVILAEVAAAHAELSNVVDWLDAFLVALPLGVPGDFTQVFMWAVPVSEDPRSQDGAG